MDQPTFVCFVVDFYFFARQHITFHRVQLINKRNGREWLSVFFQKRKYNGRNSIFSLNIICRNLGRPKCRIVDEYVVCRMHVSTILLNIC